MSHEECNDTTENYIFNHDEEIKTSGKSNTVITDERREEIQKIKFGLVEPIPFQELLKKAYVKILILSFSSLSNVSVYCKKN